MPRQPRTAGEYLHIIVRGIGKQILFEDTRDREKFLCCLQKYAAETSISILAYCLMENHVHLLLHDPSSVTPLFMKKLGISYARYYNLKYERSGHLFQDRYKSEAITDDAYLLSVYRYILNNPLKAGLGSAEKYRWSSYCEYGRSGCITNTKILREMIGDEAAFLLFMHQEDNAEPMEAERPKKDDAWALATLKRLLNVQSGTALQQYDRPRRDMALALLKEKGLSIRQIERLTGINRGVIQKAKAVSANRPQ